MVVTIFGLSVGTVQALRVNFATATQLQRTEQQKKQLEQKVKREMVPKSILDQTIQQKDKEIEQIKVSRAEEKAHLATLAVAETPPAATEEASPAPASSYVAPAPAWNGACGDNSYAQAIYQQESHCSITSINGYSGACGIGQALPCSKLANVCPNWSNDYACQNDFFTSYAMQYGSWAAAYNFKFCTGVCWSSRINGYTDKGSEPWW
jgi:hypothetical protein